MSKIVAIQKDKETKGIESVMLDSKKIVGKDEAIQMVKEGEIEDMIVSRNRGGEYIKSSPDGDPTNNLKDMPTID